MIKRIPPSRLTIDQCARGCGGFKKPNPRPLHLDAGPTPSFSFLGFYFFSHFRISTSSNCRAASSTVGRCDAHSLEFQTRPLGDDSPPNRGLEQSFDLRPSTNRSPWSPFPGLLRLLPPRANSRLLPSPDPTRVPFFQPPPLLRRFPETGRRTRRRHSLHSPAKQDFLYIRVPRTRLCPEHRILAPCHPAITHAEPHPSAPKWRCSARSHSTRFVLWTSHRAPLPPSHLDWKPTRHSFSPFPILRRGKPPSDREEGTEGSIAARLSSRWSPSKWL